MPARRAPDSRSGVLRPLRHSWRFLVRVLAAAGWLRRRLVRSLSVLLLIAPLYLTFAPAPAAYGSCASTPRPSADAFTGVVLSTRSQGRVATVRLQTGVLVEVVGTPTTGNGATSVDRTYKVGGRYEFHPTNGASPFMDNACTATRLLALTPPPTPRTTSAIGWPVVAGGLILLGSLGVAAGWHAWRRRS